MPDMWPAGVHHPHETLIDLRWAGALPVGMVKVDDILTMSPGLPAIGSEEAESGGEELMGLSAPVAEADD